jgi:hypothetical protein
LYHKDGENASKTTVSVRTWVSHFRALLIVAAGVLFLAAVSLNAVGEQPSWPTRIGFGAAILCGAVGCAYLIGGLAGRRRRPPG